MRILLAEDDRVSQALCRGVLESFGYDVSVAGDGLEALRMHAVEPFHLVLTDWMMPGLDGLELTRSIRQADAKFYTYIILLTANTGQRKTYLEAMHAGVDDFLPKPLDPVELEVRLRVAKRILEASSRIGSLERVLTICAYTKQIDFPEEGWQTIETFLRRHLGITLTHGVEPGYYEKVIRPELEAIKAKTRETN